MVTWKCRARKDIELQQVKTGPQKPLSRKRAEKDRSVGTDRRSVRTIFLERVVGEGESHPSTHQK